MSERKRFGEILVEAGVLTERTLQQALEKQRQSGKHLGEILEESGVITERDVAVVLARQFGLKTVRDIAAHSFSADLLQLVDGDTCLKKLIFPLKLDRRRLFLAMVNPLDMETIDELAFRTGLSIVPCVTTREEIVAAVNRHYLGKDPRMDQNWWTILVVDDQEMVRATIRAALEREGYQVLEATNGAEGLKEALNQLPHLIIADTVMPRLTGDEMFRSLQANARTRKIPVIGLSSRSAPEEEARVLDLGYFDFIAKPINAIRLQARVRRALRTIYGDTPPPRL
ncbi:type II secretion system (T2SS) protein E [Geothermobacter ehrlichii]|uniref:Type II secretion system (T2SS) protein E n=1 Tax=Geothermobacter ehrlichii TaxID=213224 RepID=A0A5D3WI77_9BACT|nr:response regulator [Geothermobacter ehrlichii]TYO98141.1 type II secretion system (T2SS) protein E [Geothermobacter ehrlichii]